MPVLLKWFPPSWFQIKTKDKVIYIDPAWMRTLFKNYPKKIEFSKWPDPIDGLPEKDLEKADILLVTHHHSAPDHHSHASFKGRPSTIQDRSGG